MAKQLKRTGDQISMIKKILLAVLFLIIASCNALGLYSPSAAYCSALGYKYIVEKTNAGEIGICNFSDGTACGSWEFLEGKCGQEHSYCSLHSYGIKTVSTDWRNYSACVLPNGTSVEVTELMGLNLKAEKCGDGACSIGENYNTCPQDCPSGYRDGYCDGIEDGRCDPECAKGGDIDCMNITYKRWAMNPKRIWNASSLGIDDENVNAEPAAIDKKESKSAWQNSIPFFLIASAGVFLMYALFKRKKRD
jgi:putative hemolysin